MPLPRQPATAPRAPLNPALHYLLMIGSHAPGRIQGFWDLLWTFSADEMPDAIRAAWKDCGDDLIAEAAAFNFIPWGQRHRRPTGDGVTQWQAQFIAQHRY